MSNNLCIFCIRPEGDPRSWVPSNPGKGCTYGLAHEFPPSEEKQPQQAKVRDAKLCVKCGLHPKNPTSSTNGCEHEYK